jgi:hypothetical protein
MSDEEVLETAKKRKYSPLKTSCDIDKFMTPLITTTGTVGGRTVMYDKGGICIRIYDTVDVHTAKGMCVLLHEVVHACSYIFERIGMPHTQDTDEAYAYLYSYIMTTVFEEL